LNWSRKPPKELKIGDKREKERAKPYFNGYIISRISEKEINVDKPSKKRKQRRNRRRTGHMGY
jgi:hypothetical protein